MSFQVHVDCLICKQLTETAIYSQNRRDAEALNLLHNKLCLALKLEFSPKFREWDFAEEPFPYCESCIQRIQRLGELIDLLKCIEEEIGGALATISALVITSDKSDKNCVDTLIESKFVQTKDNSSESHGLQEKHNYFRSLITKRYDTRVEVGRCDENCNYPGLSDDGFDYELLPKTTFLKIEPALQELLDATAEKAALSEIKYEVETSSNLKDGHGLEAGLNETWTLLSEDPALTLVANASDKEERDTTISDSVDKQVFYEDSSKTDQLKGFKFKVLGKGVYECCTCGHVSKPNSKLNRINIKKHIKRVHVRPPKTIVPRACGECGKVFTTYEGIYQHRIYSHGAPRFQCEYCGTKFRHNFHLQRHFLKCRELEEKPRICLNASDTGGNLSNNIPVANDPVIQIRSQPQDLLCEEASETYQMNGFKYEKLEKGYKCCTCGHTFALNQGNKFDVWKMKRHIQTVHIRNSNNGSSRSCKECGNTFSNLRALNVHRAMAHAPHKFQCDHCGVKFRLNSHLEHHYHRVHKKHREQPCLGLDAPDNRGLTVPAKNDPAPQFPCDYCGAGFELNLHLQQHLLKHREHGNKQCSGLNASDRGGTLGNTITVRSDPGIQIPTLQKDLLYDEASQTYEFQGFKFKVLEKGYECCTCGLVSAVLKRKQYDKWNMKRHIQNKHMDIPRRL